MEKYTKQAQGSKLMDLPQSVDYKTAVKIIQENFNAIWRALNDMRNRIDTIKR